MYTGSLGAISNQEDWIVIISLTADDGSTFLLTGAAITVAVTDPDTPKNAIISGSVADGTIVISADGTTMTWTFPGSSKMSMLVPGVYSVFCRMVLNGLTTQLLSASVSVVEGGPVS